MNSQRNPKYWLQKRANRKTGHPVGTIAYYGPDNMRASKVVVGVIVSAKSEVAELRKWFGETIDVRHDQSINQQILDFLDQHNAQRVAMVDRLLGCPHEEGIDYPKDEICSQCPYWSQRDRWTGELAT